MKKDRETELLERIKDLESELEASICRENNLLNKTSNTTGVIDRIKRSKIGKIALSPTSVAGKIVRFPRSVLRIIRHPSIVKDIYNKSDKMNRREKNNRAMLSSLETMKGYNLDGRVNVIVASLDGLGAEDYDVIKFALDYAKKYGIILRIVSLSGENQVEDFKLLSKRNQWPLYDKIEFYSSKSQKRKGEKKMKLEVGPNDVFFNLVRER